MASSNWSTLITRLAQKYGVDPHAALAVASVEGLSGGVGDGGHAFGPFQLNDAGGVLTNRPGNHRAFAESPQGIEWAMQRIAQVAKGLKGQDAVSAIVRQFERPADPNGEVAKASARYGHVTGGGPSVKGAQVSDVNTASAGGGQNVADAMRQVLLSNLMAQTSAFANGGQAMATNPMALLQQMQLVKQTMGSQQVAPPQGGQSKQASAPSAPYSGSFKFDGNTSGLKGSFLNSLVAAAKAAGADGIKVTSGYRDPEHNKAVGGVSHSNHMTGDAMDGYAHIHGQWVPLGVALKAVANKYGLRSGDQPGFYHGGTDPVHVDDAANQR